MVPSGKRLHNYGKSPFSMGKSTISMAIFNSYGMLNGTAGAMVTPGEHLAAAKRHSAELQAVVI